MGVLNCDKYSVHRMYVQFTVDGIVYPRWSELTNGRVLMPMFSLKDDWLGFIGFATAMVADQRTLRREIYGIKEWEGLEWDPTIRL